MTFQPETRQNGEPVRPKFMKGMRSNTAYYESTQLDEDLGNERDDAQTEVQHRLRTDSQGSGFLHSLITKIRSVERVTSTANSNSHLRLFQHAFPPKPPKAAHSQAYLQKYHCPPNDRHEGLPMENGKARRGQGQGGAEEEVGRLRGENEAMREKIRQQNRMLVSSQTRLSRVEKQLEEKERMIANFEECMREKERFYNAELAEMASRIEELELQNESLQTALANAHHHHALQLAHHHQQQQQQQQPWLQVCQTVDEVVFPCQNEVLVRTQQEVRQLKVELVTQEKKMLQSYHQLRKKKEAEMEQLRRSFSKNLNHYKELIVKCTSKPTQEGKRVEDCEDTTIMEISSADSS